jgi:hypothetical protein
MYGNYRIVKKDLSRAQPERVCLPVNRYTDADGFIRLYQQAQTLFSEVGSERGAAGVFNNLGLIYGAQGDTANAEKCIARRSRRQSERIQPCRSQSCYRSGLSSSIL